MSVSGCTSKNVLLKSCACTKHKMNIRNINNVKTLDKSKNIYRLILLVSRTRVIMCYGMKCRVLNSNYMQNTGSLFYLINAVFYFLSARVSC